MTINELNFKLKILNYTALNYSRGNELTKKTMLDQGSRLYKELNKYKPMRFEEFKSEYSKYKLTLKPFILILKKYEQAN